MFISVCPASHEQLDSKPNSVIYPTIYTTII